MGVQQGSLGKNLLAILGVILLVGMIGMVIYSVRQSERERLTKLVDGFHKRFLMELAASVYDVVPVIYGDEKTLSLSAFYPFRGSSDGSIRGCRAEAILLQARLDNGQVQWYAGEKRSGRISWGKYHTARPCETPVQRSRKLLQAYLWGTRKWIEAVHTVHNKVSESAKYARAFRKQASCVVWEEKPSLKSLSFDVPRTRAELISYQAWLCRILGVGVLTDAWGRPIQLRIEGRQLMAVSAGVDGRFGTADDIVERQMLSP